jgi:putative transposase
VTDTAAEDAVGAEGLDDRAIGELVDRARAEGVNLTGPGGLLAELTKKVLESALEGEMTDHLGYEAHDPAGRNGGNSRNGHRPKTVLTEAGPVELDCPGTATPVSTRRSCRNASAA